MKLHNLMTVALGGSLLACAATPPPNQLVEARAAYQEARQGDAARYAPDDLYTAEKALKKAEKAFEEEGREHRTKDLAYIAEREARHAEYKGDIAAAKNRQKLAKERLDDLESRAIVAARRAAEEARETAERTREQMAQERVALEAEIAAQKTARAAAEAQAQKAMAELGELKRDERGTVLTLSGSVLFATGESTLLPQARERLNEVAEALKKYEKRDFIVEGHTDSRGSAQYNMELSRARANAVLDYLATHGIPRNRLEARPMGESNPVVPNDSPENRANNRRVEIVVTPARHDSYSRR